VTYRWDALDALRGLTMIAMLLNLSPGSWEFNYAWLEHAKWDGWTLIEMVGAVRSGFVLACLGVLMGISQLAGFRQVLVPARIFHGFGGSEAPLSLRSAGPAFCAQFLEPRAASFLFGVCGLAAIFLVLLVCHRKRWILKL